MKRTIVDESGDVRCPKVRSAQLIYVEANREGEVGSRSDDGCRCPRDAKAAQVQWLRGKPKARLVSPIVFLKPS
jgi:hypothetical protein